MCVEVFLRHKILKCVGVQDGRSKGCVRVRERDRVRGEIVCI